MSAAPTAPIIVNSLQRRADFLRLSAQGDKFITQSFIMLSAPQPAEHQGVRIGYTVTKKLGGAVERNRIRRRLREAVKATAPDAAQAGRDYVLIARHNALHCEFSALIRDLQFAFARIGKVKPKPYAGKPRADKPRTERKPKP